MFRSIFMSLEEKIKQDKFKSPYHKLGLNLLYASNWINYHLHCQFKNKEITPQQYNVLRILRGQYPKACNLKLIKERMLDNVSDVSRIMDKLIKKGLVTRRENENDRRNIDIIISEKGLDLLKSLDHIEDELAKLFKNLSKDEIRDLNELLDKLHSD